jgi:hypothetical protein
MSDWGKGVINDIGWGQGANNDIGWGSIYDKSNAGETLLSGGGSGYNAFIIEIKTDELGISNNDQFQFTGGQGDYDVVAKQGGAVVETFSDLSDEATITFANGAGTYILELTPKEVNPFTGIRFNDGGDVEKLMKIKQWGLFSDTRNDLFYGAENLTTLPVNNDYLNGIENINNLFRECPNIILSESITFEEVKTGTNAFLFSQLSSLPSGMNLPNLELAINMLRGCNLIDLPLGMTLPNITDATNFLQDSTINTARYSQLLVDMEAGNSNNNVSFHGGGSKYNDAGEVARNALADAAGRNWSFTDGGKE